jgi:tetratricopeptide (TPR) repeat protein
MSATPIADLQRWSADVARDPGSPAFVLLARAYRRQGQRDAALRLCLRGLERNPDHVDGHALLARLYLEAGDRRRAADEWSIVLRLDGEHFEAHRGMGFFLLESGDAAGARGHLEVAAELRPDDAAVAEALAFLAARAERRGAHSVPAQATEPAAAAEPSEPAAAAEPVSVPVSPGYGEPAELFARLEAEPPFLGALVVDTRGLVLGGRLARDAEASGRGDALAAVLGGAIEEASRAAFHMELGGWRGILLETESALVHLAPLAEGLALVVLARRDAPPAWVLRAAERAGRIARTFLETMP